VAPDGPVPHPAALLRRAASATAPLRPAEVLRLQRAVGNRAVGRLLSGGARPQGVQRLIAVNPDGNPHNDYAVMKSVQPLEAAGNGPIVMLTSQADFRGMAQNEVLYIASHGNADSGELNNVNTVSLLQWLNGSKGPPAHFGGVVVLSCYGGKATRNEPLAKRLAEGLHVRYKGKTVEGATGYAFGSPELGATGKASVLSTDLPAFYKLADLEAMIAEWGKLSPTHNDGVLGYGANFKKTISQQVSPQKIREHVTKFQKDAKQIETDLKEILARFAGTTVQEKINAMNNVANTNDRQEWDANIQAQFDLFHSYYLWEKVDAAFKSWKR
jgi:hypothetical protein